MDYTLSQDILKRISRLGYYSSNINLYRHNPYSTLYNIVLWLKYYHHIFIWIEPRYKQGDGFMDVRYIYVVQPLFDRLQYREGGFIDEIPALEHAIKYALDLIESEKEG